jgi:hypothetical protein
MSITFQKRIRIFPGLRLNIYKRGFSLTIGVPGFSFTLGKRAALNIGAPGTGFAYRKRRKNKQNKREKGHL